MSLFEQQLEIFQRRETLRFTGGGARMEIELREKAPVRSGELRRSIRVERSIAGFMWIFTVSVTAPQGKWTDEGTGVFGPFGQRITPRVAKLLAWSDGGMMHFARSVAGQRGTNWYSDTVKKWFEYLSGS